MVLVLVQRIRQETGCNVIIPPESEFGPAEPAASEVSSKKQKQSAKQAGASGSSTVNGASARVMVNVRVEGPREGVPAACADILEQVQRLENETFTELHVEQRFHRMLIGTQGGNIRQLREQFPDVRPHIFLFICVLLHPFSPLSLFSKTN